MGKGKAILIIAILLVGLIVCGSFLWRQTGNLGEARAEIAGLKNNVSTLEENVSSLQKNVSTLQANLTTSETKASSLQTDLNKATADINRLQADLKTQQNLNSTLSEELKKVKFPRHFASLTELMDWLQKDDTNTKYGDVTTLQRAFILQVRALQDGYLLPVRLPTAGTTEFVVNTAIIGEYIYFIRSGDDVVERQGLVQPLPSYPITSE